MEVVIWHEGLGSDDDAATEEESVARILFFWPPKSIKEQLRVLQLLQGVFAFATSFDDAKTASPTPSTMTHVQLISTNYCFGKVEAQVWIALGHTAGTEEDSHTLEALMQDMYACFRLVHGGIGWNLTQTNVNYADPLLHVGIRSGFDVMLHLAACRKKMRKISHLIAKVQHDDNSIQGTAAAVDLEQLQAWASELEAESPLHELQKQFVGFFPVYLSAMDAAHLLHCFHAMDGIFHHHPIDSKLRLTGHLLTQSLRLAVPDVLQCAVFVQGQFVCSGLDTQVLHCIYRLLRLREQHGFHKEKADPRNSVLWLPTKHTDSFEPMWATKQTYIDGGLSAPKKRMSAKDLFAETILNAPATKERMFANGFQCHDGTFSQQPEDGDALWLLALYPLDEDAASSQDLIVWRKGTCTLLLVVQRTPPSSAKLIAKLNEHLGRCPHVLDATQERSETLVPTTPSFGSFVHLNRVTMELQMHNLGKFRAPIPPRIVSSCFAPRLLAWLNVIRHDLASDPDIMDIFTKTSTDGWVVARRSGSLDRELVVHFDAKVVHSIADLSTHITSLVHEAFESIFM
ncbi:Aste57867_9677 [Aphanomyces stellatus]|uniref:Aste57867_9677 protein n=1 Tax=Aphanomyces stellatus TaxID=120398 RepID=A0A485KNW5_9STRA|nr:hypothetical protein As57867_009639 [Aphanomyces stellatus]VFT86556.1 Aste57867_9677 [Aphanomyces stellatus]